MSQSSSNAERAGLVLIALGEGPATGLPLRDIALRLGDTKPAVHRALTALQQLGLVEQTSSRSLYRLGEAFFRLGRGRESTRDRILRWRPVLTALGDRFGGSCFLLDRSGLDAVIIDMHLGSQTVQILGEGIGGRLPLGYGLGSMVILAMQDADNREAILVANDERYRSRGVDPASVRELATSVRNLGYDFRRNAFIRGVTGVSMPILDRGGSCSAAITISMLSEQFSDEMLSLVLQEMSTLIGTPLPVPRDT